MFASLSSSLVALSGSAYSRTLPFSIMHRFADNGKNIFYLKFQPESDLLYRQKEKRLNVIEM